MTRVREKSVNLDPEAYDYLTECVHIMYLLNHTEDDPYLSTLRGCAELSALLLLRKLISQVEDAGLLHLVPADLLDTVRFKRRPQSTPPSADPPEDSGPGSG